MKQATNSSAPPDDPPAIRLHLAGTWISVRELGKRQTSLSKRVESQSCLDSQLSRQPDLTLAHRRAIEQLQEHAHAFGNQARRRAQRTACLDQSLGQCRFHTRTSA